MQEDLELHRVVSFRRDMIGSINFFEEIDKLYKEGWEIYHNNEVVHAPRLFPHPSVTMRKIKDVKKTTKVKVEVDQPSTENLLKELNELKEFKAIKSWAEKNKIEMPEKVYNPAAVKKHIKEKLNQ